MAKQTIPDTGFWSSIASLHNANYDELYASDVTRKQIIRGSDITNQVPGIGVPTDVKFGSLAINGPSDPVSMGADNIFTFNQAGNYHLRLSMQGSRTASSGTAIVYLGVFLDPDVGTFTQVGQSVEFIVPDSNTNIPYQAELTADMLVGYRFKVMIQVTGAADAGLFANTAVPNSWNDVFSADALISQYFYEP